MLEQKFEKLKKKLNPSKPADFTIIKKG